MARLAFVLLSLVTLLGCRKIVDRIRAHHADDDEVGELIDDEADAACPMDLVPGYCRHRCKSFASRQATSHAQRMPEDAEHAFGKCGDYDVFAQRAQDGKGITEYYDDAGALVGATDQRRTCGKYGLVPTCTAGPLSWTK